jgi:hypothetical protein
MILTQDELHPKQVLPVVEDNVTAARVSTLFCWLAALWFFLSPWAFFGVSEQASAWNSWLLGGGLVLLTMLRLIAPLVTSWVSWICTVSGVWIFISPWVLGYSGYGARTVNSIAVGSVLIGFSIMSRVISRQWPARAASQRATEE